MAKFLKWVNLLNGVDTSTTSTTYTAFSYTARWYYDASKFDAVAGVYFEAVLRSGGSSYTAYAALFDEAGNMVSGSEVSVTGTAWVRVRSGDLRSVLVSGTTYHFRLRTNNGIYVARVYDARVVIAQDGTITKTQTEIEIGNSRSQTESATTWTVPDRCGAWEYHADAWDGVQAIYFDVGISIAAGGNTGEICLWDRTTWGPVNGSITQFTSSTWARITSADFKSELVDGHLYEFRVRSQPSASTITLGHLRVVVVQSGFYKTECYHVNCTYASFIAAWTNYCLFRADPADWDVETIEHRLGAVFYPASGASTYAALLVSGSGTELARCVAATDDYALWWSSPFDPDGPSNLYLMVGVESGSGTHYYYGGYWLVKVSLGAPPVEQAVSGALGAAGAVSTLRRRAASVGGSLGAAGVATTSLEFSYTATGALGATGTLEPAKIWMLTAGRPKVVLEVAFDSAPGQTPVWVDVSYYVREVHIRRGRQHELGQPEAGTATILLDNRLRNFDPAYQAGPFYGKILPMRRVRVSAEWEGTCYPLFTGFAESWGLRWGPGLDGVCELQAVDGFKALGLLKVVELSVPQELSGARIQRLLDYTGMSGTFVGEGFWVLGDPTTGVLGSTTKVASELVAFRNIEAGQSVVQADTVSDSILSHMLKVAESEGGMLFIDAAGRLTFHDRHHRLLHETYPVAIFGDQMDASEWPYADLELSYDDYWLYNEVRLTRRGGTEQVASDAASQQSYLTRTYSATDLLLTSDGEVLSRAQDLLGRYKQPAIRSEQLALEPTGIDPMWPVVLARELSNRISVLRRPGWGGQVLVQDYYIEKITHDITDTGWTITWQMSPAPAGAYWQLGTSSLGVDTRLAS